MSAVADAVASLTRDADETGAPFAFTADEDTNTVTFQVKVTDEDVVDFGTIVFPAYEGGVYATNIVGGNASTIIEADSVNEAAGLLSLAYLFAAFS